jgi:hypothetical protein
LPSARRWHSAKKYFDEATLGKPCFVECLHWTLDKVYESRLKGVDRRKLKFTTLNTLQAGVSVRINVKSGREGKTNQPRNKADRHGDLFYRGSVLKNLVSVEVVTKTRSLSTLSLSQTVTWTE